MQDIRHRHCLCTEGEAPCHIARHEASRAPTGPGPAVACRLPRARPDPLTHWRHPMGKYFLAWLLGVPGIILLLLYLFFR